MKTAEFWNSDFASKVKHPEPLRQLLETLAADPDHLFNLTFYAAFANRMYTVMRREGKETQGFGRMQQSFSEAVQKVRESIAKAGEKGFARAGTYTEMSQAGMAKLIELTEDLSFVKAWQVSEDGGEQKG